MSISAPRAKRTDIAERIADCLLESGVAQIPLRDLAVRLGTSDRMLLYYFSDKTDLVETSLGIVSTRLAALLGPALGAEKRAAADLALEAVQLLLAAPMAPYMAVWGDLSARAGRDEEPFRTIAAKIMDGWMGWIEGRLKDPDRAAVAAILVLLEGTRLVETIRPGSADGALDLLTGGFDRKDRSAADS